MYTQGELRTANRIRILKEQGTNKSKPGRQRLLIGNGSSMPAGYSPLQAATSPAAQTSSQLHTPPPALLLTYHSPQPSTTLANPGSSSAVPIYPARTTEDSATAGTQGGYRAGMDRPHEAESPSKRMQQSERNTVGEVSQSRLGCTMLQVHQLGGECPNCCDTGARLCCIARLCCFQLCMLGRFLLQVWCTPTSLCYSDHQTTDISKHLT